MNLVALVGRLTRDPDIRYTNDGTSIASFTVAVDRRFKKEGSQTADFISCKAFGKTAEIIEKYFFQGKKIGLTGRIQTGSYTNREGNKVYTTDVVCDAVEFVESKGSGGDSGRRGNEPDPPEENEDFMDIPEGMEEELPFI